MDNIDTMRLRWDDPSFWGDIRVDYCENCGEGHVLRRGLCWDCRPKVQR